MDKVTLSKRVIDAAQAPDKGRAFIHDDRVPGLAVQVTRTGAKTFQLVRKFQGKALRITLGRYPAMTPEQARKSATEHLATLARGNNPNVQKQRARVRGSTLGEVAKDYVASRDLKPSSAKDIDRVISETFDDWKGKPISEITPDMVLKRHRERCAVSKARANAAFRWLRALWNYQRSRYRDEMGQPLLPENPVRILTDRKGWARVSRKQTMVPPHLLKPWWDCVNAFDDQEIRDFLITLLLTGLRKSEAQGLLWEHVNLVTGSITVTDTKNHRDHTLPLGRRLLKRFEVIPRSGIYVFGGNSALADHRYRNHLKTIEEVAGIHATPHDLRRTFATVAESLDLSELTLKKLLNHVTTHEVTGGYVVFTPDRLRDPIQRIEDYIAGVVE